MVFDASDFEDHEQVTYFSDEESGLQAIVAIHDTSLGPSLGGTRMREYGSPGEALTDVLRLSYAMTYKAAAADLDLGGGKAVLIGSPGEKDEAMLRSFGRGIEHLGGRYITSVDVNTSVRDMDVVAKETEYVTATSSGLGDPSPITARGVLSGIQACIEYEYGRDTVSGTTVAIQGLGKVGKPLAAELAERGASVIVTDLDEDEVSEFAEEFGAEGVGTDEIYDVSCDVFAPCAFGGAINDETIPRLDCNIVAGAANNILADETRHASVLRDQGILYAPDYVINAGGLITVAKDYRVGDRREAFRQAEKIGDRLMGMIERAEREETTVLEASQQYVEDRLNDARRTHPASAE